MPAPQPDPGGEAGRIRCLYCGANNFPASAACWQCSRPLRPMPPAPANSPGVVAPSPAAAAPVMPGGGIVPTHSALAPKAAAALGMLFPLVGLPAGLVFLMLDDPRKTQLGWILIGWSLAGTLLSVVPLLLSLGPLWAVLHGLLPRPGAPAPAIPGLPTDGGEGLLLLLARLQSV